MPPDEASSAGAGWHDWDPPTVPPPLPPPNELPPTVQQDEDDAIDQLMTQIRLNHSYLLNMTPTVPSETPADESMLGGH